MMVDGVIVQGHQVASGQNPKSPYPKGSIEMQLPIFKSLGLDLTTCHPATLNVSLAIDGFSIVQPDFHFVGVNWTPIIPPETFSFVACKIYIDQARYDGWLYYPNVDTKPDHLQPNNVMEVISNFIPDIHYDKAVKIEVDGAKVLILK